MTQGPPPTPPSGRRRGTRAARATYERVRRATHAGGAGESGLSRLIEMHAVNAAGDALIAVSLAGTLFFSVPTGEARSQVALYLLLTMAPFAVVAPLVGPFLDRFRHGRRWAIGISTASRGFLCWVMAGAVSSGGEISLYAAAFGCLVASRAYGVSRAAAVPRVLPEAIPLVSANSRISLAGVAGASLAAPVGLAVAAIGPDWALRLAFGVFVAATVQAIRLPARIDSAAGEEPASISEGPPGEVRDSGDDSAAADPGVRTTRPLPVGRAGRLGRRGPRYRVGSAVVRALRANVALRGFTGFLTIYLAFVLREVPVAGLSPEVGLALGAAAAMLGGTAGSAVGARLRTGRPDRIVLALDLVAVAAAALAALLWGLATMLLVALLAGFTQQLGRLSLDAVVQRDVPERVRTSTFARSETSLQLAWVVGGGLALALPLDPTVGFAVAGGLVAVGLALAARVRLDYPASPPVAPA